MHGTENVTFENILLVVGWADKRRYQSRDGEGGIVLG